MLQPDVATNKVAFKLFGLIPGYVGLRGSIEPVGEGRDTVKVFFDQPVLSFGNAFTLRIGGWLLRACSREFALQQVTQSKCSSTSRCVVWQRVHAAHQWGLHCMAIAIAAALTLPVVSMACAPYNASSRRHNR